MKKFLLSVALCSASLIANAEVFIGGLAGIAYSDETFSMMFAPCIGYEFNEKMAIGTGVGFGVYDGDGYAVVNPFLRFTPCQNERVAFDLKLQSNMQFDEGESYALIGISPCVRAKLSEHWQLACDFGLVGIECYGGCTPSFSIKNCNVNAAILYKFGKKSEKKDNQ